MFTYVGSLFRDGTFHYVPQHVDGRARFYGDACLHALLVYIPNQLFWRCLSVRLARGRIGSCGGDGGLVVKAVEVTARALEVFDPPLWLK